MLTPQGFRGSQRSGVSLVEILIALFVFLIAGSGILSATLSSHQLAESANTTMRAVDDLDDIMERIAATPFAGLQGRFPDGVPNGGASDYAAMVGGYTLDNEQITVTYPSVATGRVEMLVTVSWTYRGRVMSSRLSTVRTSG